MGESILNFIKILLLFLSAFLYVQTYPANDYPLLVWIALIPWLLSLNFLSLEKNSWKKNTLSSLFFSTLIWLIYLWTPFYDAAFVISNEIFVASLLTFLHLLTYMIPFIVVGLIYHRFNSYRIIDAVYLASIFTFLSMTIPTLFTFNMGTCLYNYPLLLQVLDISGISLLLWLIVLMNLSLKNIILLLWHKKVKKDFLQNSLVVLCITCFVLGYGFWNLQMNVTKEIKDKITIATVQPNMGSRLPQLSMVRDNKLSTPYSHIELTRKALAENKEIDLIVWPEGGLIVDCDNKALFKKLSTFTQEISIPLIYQCNQCTNIDSLKSCYNQSHYMGITGKVEAIYNKQNLIPLFENIPKSLKETFIEKKFHNELLFEKGKDTQLFYHPQARIIPAICYDGHSAKLIRKGLKLRGQLLVIQSNDRIFKQSHIGLFDTAINIISAISFRIPMVKSSNSGYGVFLSASGEIIEGSLTPLNKRHISINTLELRDTFASYREYGDWFYWLLLIFVLYHTYSKSTIRSS